jgi:heme exporter protein B
MIALPLFGIFYNVHWTAQWPQLTLVILLATWGMTITGTVFSALTVNIRLREVMLPILNFPILVPALLGAMQLTSALVNGQPITDANSSWLKMLIGFDIMYTAVSLFLVETVLVG